MVSINCFIDRATRSKPLARTASRIANSEAPLSIAPSASSVTLVLLLPVIDSPLQPLAVLVSDCGSPDFPPRYCGRTGRGKKNRFWASRKIVASISSNTIDR
jgi:hypothetical protein